jgi:hypothetical protein
MTLPAISTPEFFDVIPSTKEEIIYRPFLVGEEKNLLIALEGKEQKEISNAIIKVLKDCILSDIDITKLATFDIEYMFLKIRGKSVGEVITVRVGHQESDCKHKTELQVNLDDIKVVGEIKKSEVMINDDVGVKLRYPTLKSVMNMKGDDADSMFTMICENIECLYDKDNMYSDFTLQEIEEWVGKLNKNQFNKITEFYESIPKLSHDITWKCPECGEEETIKLEGLQSFFTLQ